MDKDRMVEEIVINSDGSKTVRMIFTPSKEYKGDEVYGTNL